VSKETDARLRPDACEASSNQEQPESISGNLKYALLGTAFGIVFVKAEVISWFRIQEMFRSDSFHMYGVIGTAVATGALSVFIIKFFRIKTVQGEEVVFPKKTFNRGQVFGGLLFGLGWALTASLPRSAVRTDRSRFPAVLVTLLECSSRHLVVWLFQK
jgi:hypothetical protein